MTVYSLWYPHKSPIRINRLRGSHNTSHGGKHRISCCFISTIRVLVVYIEFGERTLLFGHRSPFIDCNYMI